ncbi:MAG: riboflavin synthase [Alphaproteobacteria bacterium]|jgi:riboflavin synthase
MFTGLIKGLGRLIDVKGDDEKRMRFETPYFEWDAKEGASMACNGCCLTVLNIQKTDSHWQFSADLSQETLRVTGASSWRLGEEINLEPSLRLGEELGGHIVSGHVDGQAKLVSCERLGDNHVLIFEVPDNWKGFVAAKGSIALNGVSLTINDVDDTRFSVNIIPHTWAVTNLKSLEVGHMVNFEVDMLARYLARMLQVQGKLS